MPSGQNQALMYVVNQILKEVCKDKDYLIQVTRLNVDSSYKLDIEWAEINKSSLGIITGEPSENNTETDN